MKLLVTVRVQEKDSNLVYEAFMNADIKLGNIRLFHTAAVKSLIIKSLVKCLETFDIKRSLSKPGCPYDNAVAEAPFSKLLRQSSVI